MLKIAIIDDELSAREVLINLLKSQKENIVIVGEADGVESGIALIEETQPDLVLLDINLKDGTGFDLLKSLDQIRFKLIFVTAYDRFALNAIKFSALDYILKPVSPSEIRRAIDLAFSAIEMESLNIKLNAFFNNFKHLEQGARKIVLNTASSIYLLSVQDIIRCQSEGDETLFYLANGEQILAAKPLKAYAELLLDYNFIRIHKNHLVNLELIERFDRKNQAMLILKDKAIIPVSERYKEILLERMLNFQRPIK